jgi:hypothetical protein
MPINTYIITYYTFYASGEFDKEVIKEIEAFTAKMQLLKLNYLVKIQKHQHKVIFIEPKKE